MTLPVQEQVLQWAVTNFGPIARNRDERAARMVEEAVEVCQAEGVPEDIVQRIVARVYARPPGELWQEIGGLVLGLYALAANAGLDIEQEFQKEWARVQSKPREWWIRKHAEKVAAGTANLTPLLDVEEQLRQDRLIHGTSFHTEIDGTKRRLDPPTVRVQSHGEFASIPGNHLPFLPVGEG